MTKIKHRENTVYKPALSFLVLSLFILLSFFASEKISKEILSGLKFSVSVILPSVFPFMVFSDFASRCFEFERSNFLCTLFERTFKINRCAISAFFSGMVGGFPVGAKNALMLYDDGKISKCECERLMSFSNMASPAYTVSAVGIGLLSDIRIGILLYSVLVFSALLSGFLIGIKKNYIQTNAFISRQNYSFVSSIRSASIASVNLIFFVSFFSCICAAIKSLPLSIYLKSFFCAVLEVSNSIAYISDLCILNLKFRLCLIAFSLSFSGISVITQSLALSKTNDLNIKKCIVYKLIQGAVSSVIILLLPI